jgi:hypothetical protein
MFNNLLAEIARAHMTIKDLAKTTGINYCTLQNKARGRTEFTRKEMFLIKSKCFPTMQVDDLFATDDSQQQVV